MARPTFGLVLGSGSARGWAHIGVLRALADAGIRPDLICGTSVGAFIGAAYADNSLDRLEPWARGLDWRKVLRFFDVRLAGGLIKGERLVEFFAAGFGDKDMTDLSMPFGCVATDLATGREVWFREGSVVDAVRASVAVPGLLAPHLFNGRLLVDGGLVDPVPVSLARAMGAELILAIELGSDLVRHRHRVRSEVGPGDPESSWTARMRRWMKLDSDISAAASGEARALSLPSLADVMMTSINIMEVRIARARLAGDPADVIVRPQLADIGMLDYYRAGEAIDEGYEAMTQALPQVRALLEAESWPD
jgi:NTE family protein